MKRRLNQATFFQRYCQFLHSEPRSNQPVYKQKRSVIVHKPNCRQQSIVRTSKNKTQKNLIYILRLGNHRSHKTYRIPMKSKKETNTGYHTISQREVELEEKRRTSMLQVILMNSNNYVTLWIKDCFIEWSKRVTRSSLNGSLSSWTCWSNNW